MPAIFITGVSGSGKSTIGRLLSEQTGLPFFDGDDFHSPANVAKMRSGIPLDDTDRMGWLSAIHEKAVEMLATGNGAIFACSALKKMYRDILSEGIESQTRFVLLDSSYDLILSRLQARKGHYMPPNLLQSQFDILERTDDVVAVNLEKTPAEIVEQIMLALNFYY